jgi:hypothetical protein
MIVRRARKTHSVVAGGGAIEVGYYFQFDFAQYFLCNWLLYSNTPIVDGSQQIFA